MPPLTWPSEPSAAILDFERRHPAPDAGALLLFATTSVEALHYLYDLDSQYDSTRALTGAHNPDVVDVAHARWATGTAITALDLVAAAFGRALGGHAGPKELDLRQFGFASPPKAVRQAIAAIPSPARNWIDRVRADPEYSLIKSARDALTHRRLARHFHASLGTTGPSRRIDLQIGSDKVAVQTVVQRARDLATHHVLDLVQLLPTL